VHIPEILENCVSDHNEQKLNFQIFWKVISGHREILLWSRNSGPVFFDPTETLCMFQNFLGPTIVASWLVTKLLSDFLHVSQSISITEFFDKATVVRFWPASGGDKTINE
jgi:hypothetical protein